MDNHRQASPTPAAKAHEQARNALVMACLPLAFSGTSTRQLQQFITAARALQAACTQDNTPEHPLDVLFWLRRHLNQQAQRLGQSEFYRAHCRRAAKALEDEIAASVVTLSRGGLCRLD
ncbi:hypothetical protein ACRSLK_14835 [Halopseudomonas pachastrellae]|uniref:hypothetical protein n=1 Tax=Halopseudomonas pachastrellae TaxID=254161 RepID=UPI003D7EAD14